MYLHLVLGAVGDLRSREGDLSFPLSFFTPIPCACRLHVEHQRREHNSKFVKFVFCVVVCIDDWITKGKGSRACYFLLLFVRNNLMSEQMMKPRKA